MKRCVFFDRDGVVNESPGPGYVERWEDFRFIPAFADALRVVREHGYVAVIVSNQRGVALGRMTQAAVEDMHAQLRALLRDTYGEELLDIFFCPHDRNQCTCRKPQPGMLLAAAARHDIDLSSSWMVGDMEKDIEAGRAAGCRTIRIGDADASSGADFTVRDMSALVPLLDRLLVRPPSAQKGLNP